VTVLLQHQGQRSGPIAVTLVARHAPCMPLVPADEKNSAHDTDKRCSGMRASA
jgi:hypothetical protein